MSKSVKLSDGSYIDASAVWDNIQGATAETLHKTSIRAMDTLNAANADVYDHVSQSQWCYCIVLSEESGHTLTNWIGNADGIIVRLGRFMLAVDAWNGKFYANVLWGTTWKGWTLIS